MSMSVHGQHVVVMGGTSGVGLAVALELTRRGASVTVTGRDPDRLAAARDTLTHLTTDSAPATASAAPKPDTSAAAAAPAAAVDSADPTAVAAFFAHIGSFDHLVVAVSGGAGAGPFRELDLAELRTGFDGKFWPQLTALQGALYALRPDGSVTLVTAISSRSAQPGTAGLAGINGALEAMIPTLAVELAPLRVNAVSPGVIDTPWWHFLPAEQRTAIFTEYADRTPLGRIGHADDVADAIAYLVGNTFTTGIVLPCDGGLHLPRP